MQLNPYLMFAGDCETAFKFYERVLGARIQAMLTSEGTPMAEHVAPEWRQKIMHARLSLDGQLLMGSDAPPDQYQPMTGFSVTLSTEDPAEAERIFAALAEGGKITMPIEETFWAQRFGMLTDRYGTPWMINCERAH